MTPMLYHMNIHYMTFINFACVGEYSLTELRLAFNFHYLLQPQ